MNTVETEIRSQLARLDTLRQDQLMESVVSYTAVVVNDALEGNWNRLLDNVDQRRRVLDRLLVANDGRHAACIHALQSAVEESERAVARVIAHAIASSRRPGAMFAMLH